MFKTIRYRCLNLKENYGLIFFHFLHSTTAILLLLLVGQVANNSDSTKAKLFQMIIPTKFNNENIWYWIIGLLATKFIATFLKNYFHQIVNFRIHNKILSQLLMGFNFHEYKSIDQETSRYVKSYSKGILLLISDLFLLSLLYFLLSKLNVAISNYWLIFLLSGLALRIVVVKYFVDSKYQFKRAINSMNRRWSFIFNHQMALVMDHQFNKEYNILLKREKSAEVAMKRYGSQHAWTAGFFPVYFYVFLFVIAWNFKAIDANHSSFLQIILLIIYSQGSMMRMFKIPAHWKEMSEIETRWNQLEFTQRKLSDANLGLREDFNTHHWDLSNYSKPMLRQLFLDCYDKTKQAHLISLGFYQSIFVLDRERKMIGDTYLGAILTDKESRQFPVLGEIFQQAPPYDWANFPWKNMLDLDALSQVQLNWMYFFKAILHPGELILFKRSTLHEISNLDMDIFLNLAKQYNKKIYFIDEEDI